MKEKTLTNAAREDYYDGTIHGKTKGLPEKNGDRGIR